MPAKSLMSPVRRLATITSEFSLKDCKSPMTRLRKIFYLQHRFIGNHLDAFGLAVFHDPLNRRLTEFITASLHHQSASPNRPPTGHQNQINQLTYRHSYQTGQASHETDETQPERLRISDESIAFCLLPTGGGEKRLN